MQIARGGGMSRWGGKTEGGPGFHLCFCIICHVISLTEHAFLKKKKKTTLKQCVFCENFHITGKMKKILFSPTDHFTPWQPWCWRLQFQVRHISVCTGSFSARRHQLLHRLLFLISFAFFRQLCPTCSSLLSPCWRWAASCSWSPTCR